MEEKEIFEIPHITTYDREELDLETVLTGGGKSDLSDRRLKENFRTVDIEQILGRLKRF